MEKLIRGLEPQSSFPESDLTDDNALFLELWLQNSEIFDETHKQTERIILYMASHACVKHLATRLGKETTDVGLNIGAAAYEVTSALIKPTLETYDTLAIAHGVHSLVPTDETHTTSVDMLLDARDTLREECPNFAYVIGEVAARRSRALSEAAITGAGLMRSSELTTRMHLNF